MKLTITGYSTALFSTWFFVEELGLLFDAGDGVSSGLLQKSMKVKHVFISHADRDHLGGLLQFNQLNARDGFPIIYYPQDAGSFPAMRDFTTRFDPQSSGSVWKGIKSNSFISVKNDLEVEIIKNGHVPVENDEEKSFSFKVHRVKKKLKPEFAHLKGLEIKELKEKQGEEFVTEIFRENIFGFSGDSPVEDVHRWDGCKVLIHEATFIDSEDIKVEAHGNKHSRLEEVIKMVAASDVEQLILSHFSSRYSAEHIDKNIRTLCEKYQLKILVRRILPGELQTDILQTKAVNE